MQEYVIKYSANVYQRKITALNGYYSRLSAHLEQLNTYHSQMREFWDGSSESENFYGLISDKINEVRKAMEDCQNINMEYQKIVDGMTNASAAVDALVNNVADASKQAVDVAGAAAKVAALI